MRRILFGGVLALSLLAVPVIGQQAFTLEQILSAPFAADLRRS